MMTYSRGSPYRKKVQKKYFKKYKKSTQKSILFSTQFGTFFSAWFQNESKKAHLVQKKAHKSILLAHFIVLR